MTKISEAILYNTKAISLVLHDPLIVQLLRDYADFFVLDCAARPCNFTTVSALRQAAGDTPFLVRPADTARATLQGLLNLGVDGFILPDIHHAAELEKIIASCLYPPEGTRPYRPVGHSELPLETINDQITFIVEIAHPQSVAQLEQIVEVTGVNGLLIVPQQLSVTMEKDRDADHHAIKQAMQTIARIAKSYELPLGIEGQGYSDIAANFRIYQRDVDLLQNSLASHTSSSKEPAEMPIANIPSFLTARRD